MAVAYEIRPIRAEEWLPDRCVAVDAPLAARDASPRCGCPSLLFGESRIRNRIDFEEFYRDVLRRFSC